MDKILEAQNDAVTAYKETNGNLRLVSFGGCGEAYKRAFRRKWNRLVEYENKFPFLKRIS